MRNNLYKISKHFKSSSVFSVPAFKDYNFQDRGRPKGGLSIIVPKVHLENPSPGPHGLLLPALLSTETK